ncbi:hypothetical protein MOD71_18620 [Bacillus haynesii]|uniref:hypothetical protein n=1 Tax=Bacillus haynesii TaxID=1925021 RepID=UPI002283016F|nr:hypothetical protein [Bacillus haynesii]MCY8737521.1 hypothetical protein [Bacillus haynesii]
MRKVLSWETFNMQKQIEKKNYFGVFLISTVIAVWIVLLPCVMYFLYNLLISRWN